MDDASQGSPGTDLVPLAGARGVPRELAVAADLALGAGSRALRSALGVGAAGLAMTRAGGRIVASLPGAGLAARAASAAVQPLAADGARVRADAVARAQRALERIVPEVVALLDVDAIVGSVDPDALLARVDADALLARIDVDAFLATVDVDALLARVDVDAFLSGVDIDTVIARVDVDAIAARIDVNAIVQQVDVDAIVEETELGTIVARSTSGFASEALDAARAQTVGVDTLVTRLVERVLRRRSDAPLGPPLLVPEEDEATAADPPDAAAR